MEYHFLTASTSYYKGNNFNDLIKEEKNYDGFVYWYIGRHKVKKGDICFIYYANLPDYSSRILFVSEVYESDYDSNDNKPIFKGARAGENYAKLKLRPVLLEDSNMLSLERLRNHYHLIHPEGQFSYLHVYEDKHGELIKDILDNVKYTKKNLEYVSDYFNNNYCMCEFGCKPFIEENGFYYIERHHLVEKNLINKYKNNKSIQALIEDKRNLYNLCPNCHMKIHHIRIEERKKMIKQLYEKNKKFYDHNFNELKGNNNSLEWLYEIYKCNK